MIGDRHHLRNLESGVLFIGKGGEGRQVDVADRVAVGLGLHQARPADLAVSARQIVDDHRLADFLFGQGHQKTGARIRAGTGLVGHDHAHVLFRRPGLGGQGNGHSHCQS